MQEYKCNTFFKAGYVKDEEKLHIYKYNIIIQKYRYKTFMVGS